jgi:hypothetical protein
MVITAFSKIEKESRMAVFFASKEKSIDRLCVSYLFFVRFELVKMKFAKLERQELGLISCPQVALFVQLKLKINVEHVISQPYYPYQRVVMQSHPNGPVITVAVTHLKSTPYSTVTTAQCFILLDVILLNL